MILLLVCDGLRPDLLSEADAPFIEEMAAQGARCRASHAVFPSSTRINAASLSTGCYPDRHGIVDNELYSPAVDPRQAVSCADWRALRALAEAEGGPVLTAPTLAERACQAGLRVASGGSGSPGTTYLTNPSVTGPVVNWAVAWPRTLEDTLTRYGAMLPIQSDALERTRFVLRALSDEILPRHRPHLVTVWITEPDHAQHEHGLGSPQARAALRAVDGLLRELVRRVAELDGPPTCFLLSDHGFGTVSSRPNIDAELGDAGFAGSGDEAGIVRTSQSLYLRGAMRQRAGEVARWLAARPWVGGVWLRDDMQGAWPEAMTISQVRGLHRRAGEIVFSYAWSRDRNTHGVAGMDACDVPLAAIHGSASPHALRNTLIAWGPGIESGIVSDVPCGLVDVAPTVLHLLGVSPDGMDGRVLHELLSGGPDPSTMEVSSEVAAADLTTADGPRRQEARFALAAGRIYLDCVTIT